MEAISPLCYKFLLPQTDTKKLSSCLVEFFFVSINGVDVGLESSKTVCIGMKRNPGESFGARSLLSHRGCPTFDLILI